MSTSILGTWNVWWPNPGGSSRPTQPPNHQASERSMLWSAFFDISWTRSIFCLIDFQKWPFTWLRWTRAQQGFFSQGIRCKFFFVDHDSVLFWDTWKYERIEGMKSRFHLSWQIRKQKETTQSNVEGLRRTYKKKWRKNRIRLSGITPLQRWG